MSNEQLVALIQAGERDRIPELWAQVEKLVMKKACQWHSAFDGRNGSTLDDYMQDGFIGFLYAVDYYRPDRGSSFANLLVLCIKTPFRKTAGVWSKVHDPLHEADSLDAPVSAEEDGDPAGEFIVDPQSEAPFLDIEAQQLREALRNALDKLTEEQRTVIKLRHCNGMTVVDVAKKLGISTQDVRYLESTGIRRLRAPDVSKKLKEFM